MDLRLTIGSFRAAAILAAASCAVLASGQASPSASDKNKIVEAMRAREQGIVSFEASVHEKASILSPDERASGSKAGLRLHHRQRDLSYQFQSTQKQFKFADLKPSPDDGHKGVQVFDGKYELSFQLTKNPADEKYQIGTFTKGCTDWYSPLLLGYWSPADESPLGAQRSAWSDFFATCDLTSAKTEKDPVFGPAFVAQFKLADGSQGEIHLSVSNAYLPFAASWGINSPDYKTGFTYRAKNFKVVNKAPVVTSATCGDYVKNKGVTVQSQDRTYELTSVKVNKPGFAIDFTLPENARFDKYIPGEEQGQFFVHNGELKKAPDLVPRTESKSDLPLMIGVGSAIVVAVTFGILFWPMTKQKRVTQGTL